MLVLETSRNTDTNIPLEPEGHFLMVRAPRGPTGFEEDHLQFVLSFLYKFVNSDTGVHAQCFCCPDTRLPLMTWPVHRVYFRQRRRSFLVEFRFTISDCSEKPKSNLLTCSSGTNFVFAALYGTFSGIRVRIKSVSFLARFQGYRIKHKMSCGSVFKQNYKKKKKTLCRQVHQSKQTETNVCWTANSPKPWTVQTDSLKANLV